MHIFFLFLLREFQHGVQQEIVDLSDASIEIPQFGTKHSLNVSVCIGVVLWEFLKKMGKV